jgi:GNAT superfamily N-acetyltransferase
MESNLFEAYTRLGQALGGEFHQRGGLLFFFTGRPVFFCNGVICCQLSEQEADELIPALCAEARSRQVALTWLLAPSSRPADLEQRLLAQGCRLDEEVPGMAIELGRPLPVTAPPVPEELVVEEVSDTSAMATWLQVLCDGFGFPEPIRAVFFDLYHRYGFVQGQPVHYLLGFWRGEPVATALLTVGGEMAGLYGVATLPQVRRQGIGTAMTLAAMRQAERLGYRHATLQATPMGLNVYRRLGWQEYCLFKTYVYA